MVSVEYTVGDVEYPTVFSIGTGAHVIFNEGEGSLELTMKDEGGGQAATAAMAALFECIAAELRDLSDSYVADAAETEDS